MPETGEEARDAMFGKRRKKRRRSRKRCADGMDAPDGPMGLKRQVGERKSREAGRLDEKNYTNYPVPA